jgi:hypothetical protein
LTDADYLQELDACGEWEPLSSRERSRQMRAWRQVFAQALHQTTGKWKHRGFDWHLFSYEFAPALNGDEAFSAYGLITPDEVFVIPEDSRLDAVCLLANHLPNFRPQRGDVTVWPRSLNWTMAFTHEESLGLGPYFCRRETVEASR